MVSWGIAACFGNVNVKCLQSDLEELLVMICDGQILHVVIIML